MNKYLKIFYSGFLGSIAIAIVAFLGEYSAHPLILGSFGASCVLLFGFPASPFSQAKNLIFGHFLCTLIGLVFFKFLGSDWWFMAVAIGLAIVVMQLTDTVHPPAGSNPVIIYLTQPDWLFLLFPTLVGALILLVISKFFQKLTNIKF